MMPYRRSAPPILAAALLVVAGCADRRAELFQATAAGDVGAVTGALSAGANVDAKDRDSHWTPLMLAGSRDDVATMRALLAAGADPNGKVHHEGTTALI